MDVRPFPTDAKTLIHHSILSPEAIAAVMQAEYDLPSPVECSLFWGGVNEIYLLTCGRDKYIARITRVERLGPVQESECRFELELIDWLYARGVSVARPLRRSSGDALGAIEAPEGKRYYALFPFVEGDVISSPDAKQAYVLGETLAKLHLAGDAFSSTHSRPRLDEHYLIDGPMCRLKQFPGISVAGLEILRKISEVVREEIRAVPTGTNEFGIIHGDFWWKNVIFADGQAVVIDFDFCGYGYRAYDVALLTGTAKLFGKPLPSEATDSFVSGYRSIRELSAVEQASLLAFERARMIWACGLWATHANVFGSQWFFECFEQALASIQRTIASDSLLQ